jgi:hypothetical protein
MPTCRVYVAKLKDLCLPILQKQPLESISSILYPTLITHEAEIREGASASISPRRRVAEVGSTAGSGHEAQARQAWDFVKA